MNFLEKDLETIIWENYDACIGRGLRLDHHDLHRYGKRFRQMNLMPYGIADLVNVYFDPSTCICYVQVIECKREKITGSTYLQAKRYVAAIEEVLHVAEVFQGHEFTIQSSIYLVGASVDTNTELAHAISLDKSCRTYCYKYDFDGIRFDDRSNWWWLDTSPFMSKGVDMVDYNNLRGYILDQREQYRRYKIGEGDPLKPILITKDGLLINPFIDLL